ncbi:MAG: AlpA family transcriptional regulator [Pseudomonadota bacterium]
MTPRLLRRPDVESLTGLGRSAIYQKVAAGDFPPPVRLGLRAVAWREAEVLEWIEARPAAVERRAAA